MSALLGIYHLDGKPAERTDLDRMLASLSHRGPDGAASWRAGGVGLGHLMLRTTPRAAGERLPLANRTGNLAVTADARIHNREELVSALGIEGHASAENVSDGELILAAYERWGERCAEKLVGDFAFAVWDADRQHLYCARDPIGVKPFYYSHTGELFAFASEIKGVLGVPGVPRRLNELRVADHLLPMFEDKESTFYRDVFRLPPAHYLLVGREGLQVRSYWRPDPASEVRFGSDEEYARAFRSLFTEAVRCRLRGDGCVGATLSGGLDSSSIACTARNVLADEGDARPLPTFSAIFPGLPAADLKRIDERRYVEAVLASGGFEPHYVRADRLSPLGELSTVLRHIDEPFVAPNLYLHWALYAAARQQGARVVLDGIDGDTTVSHGLGYLAELAGAWRWITLAREAASLSSRAGSSFTPRRIVWEYGIRPIIPRRARKVWRALRGGSLAHWATESVIAPDFARRMGLASRAEALMADELSPPRSAWEAHARGVTAGLVPYVLELADKAAAAFGIEPRYPFFDRRLIDFCLALPPEQKLQGGWTRLIMRRAMAGILPPEVQWRHDKANLSPNFTLRLLECERETLDRTVVDDSGTIEEFVDLPALRRAYQRYAAPATRNPQDALIIYRAVVLAQWLRDAGVRS